MASNEKNIIIRYGDGSREENRSLGNRADYNMEYKYTKQILDRYITKDSTVLEIGCGTGYYGMYLTDKCKKYVGVDIAPGNIELLRKKIRDNNLSNVEAFVGDATNLSHIEDNSFDVVLVFGPVYHLPPDESELAFAESKRICKPSGIIMFSYINKIGVYIGACLNQPEVYPNSQKNKSILNDGIDDTRDNIYWFTTPEEMEETARTFRMEVIENSGVDFIFMPEMFNQPPDRKEAWEEFADFLCRSKSCAGFANHAVIVCRK